MFLLNNRYEVLKELGGGGFAVTYLARDNMRPAQPICVVKQLRPHRANDPRIVNLFEKEAAILEQLGTHPQIPRLLAHFRENNAFYIVQEYIDGQDLSLEIQPGQQKNENYVLRLLEEVLELLEFVHRHNVIHRDIKPDNLVCRAKDGKLMLIDFGAVKQIASLQINAGGRITSSTVVIGTPGYMPWEQSRGSAVFSSDIYALGIVAIQALTGQTPDQFQTDSATGELIWQSYRQVSSSLADLLNSMVRHFPQNRFATATENLAALRNLNLNMQFPDGTTTGSGSSKKKESSPIPIGKASQEVCINPTLPDQTPKRGYVSPLPKQYPSTKVSRDFPKEPLPSTELSKPVFPWTRLLLLAFLAAGVGLGVGEIAFRIANYQTGEQTTVVHDEPPAAPESSSPELAEVEPESPEVAEDPREDYSQEASFPNGRSDEIPPDENSSSQSFTAAIPAPPPPLGSPLSPPTQATPSTASSPQPRSPSPPAQSTLISSTTNVNYQALRDELSQGTVTGNFIWADEATLVLMKQAVDIQANRSLPTFSNFPCEDLRIIDQLWLDYSGGKFGFSVQKGIYQSLGNTNQYNTDTWHSFGDKVGWRNDTFWLPYRNISFYTSSAPRGHLPASWSVGQLNHQVGVRDGEFYPSFLKRLVECGI